MAHQFEIDIASIENTLNNIGNNKKTVEKDQRQFRPNIKNEKKEYRAVIRLLPQGIPDKNNPKPYFVERWTHSFQENGSWYFENCPSLLNKQNKTRDHKCPVCESNRADYDSEQEVLIARAKSRRVKKSYCTNILVLEDPQTPENNGKVMYWNMPVEIQKLIELKWKPAEGSRRAPSNPYCPIKGYELELVLKFNPASGYPTYSGSEWLDARKLADTDEEILDILSKTIDLDEFTNPSNYKPSDKLVERFAKVTSGGIIAPSFTSATSATTVYAEETSSEIATKKPRAKPETSSISVKAPTLPEAPIPQVIEEGAEDTSWLD